MEKPTTEKTRDSPPFDPLAIAMMGIEGIESRNNNTPTKPNSTRL
jgi:hypothetical protein